MKKLFEEQVPLIFIGLLIVLWGLLANPMYSADRVKSYSGVCTKLEYRGGKRTCGYLTMQDGKEFRVEHRLLDKVLTEELKQDVNDRKKLEIDYVEKSDDPYLTLVGVKADGKVYLNLKGYNKVYLGYIFFSIGLALLINGIFLLGNYNAYRQQKPSKKKKKKKKA